ncbi:MAG: enoyl-CoA hydratase-related protein, partial [Pseudomonadota bacterium]
MYETLILERDARGIVTLWLNRPEKHNAMSGQMIEELTRAARELSEDESVRAVVLAAKGKSFCAGADLTWMRAQFEATPGARAREATKLARMLQTFNTLPKPLIGRVHGNAFGGGLGLLSVCDVVVATQEVQMAFTETRLGLIPATIGPYVCARMGEAKARQVFMSARRFDAREAVRLGLVTFAV